MGNIEISNEKMDICMKSPQKYFINSPKNEKNTSFQSPKGNNKNDKIEKEKLNKKHIAEEKLVYCEPESIALKV